MLIELASKPKALACNFRNVEGIFASFFFFYCCEQVSVSRKRYMKKYETHHSVRYSVLEIKSESL